MKTVRIEKGTVKEIIPDDALPVELWYGAEFAEKCREAPNEVEQGWVYDKANNTFSPQPPGPTAAEQITALKAELASTDYKAIKYAEGWLTEEEYGPVRAQRQELRDRINRLEAQNEQIHQDHSAG